MVASRGVTARTRAENQLRIDDQLRLDGSRGETPGVGFQKQIDDRLRAAKPGDQTIGNSRS
jgi:hypothetical protein